MSNIIRKAAEKATIREVKNISRAFLIENLKGEKVLTTEGANIEAMFAYEKILDLKRLHCNNIHDMARFYGIEAANKTIVKEIVNVFSVYGIDINPRHLSLIGELNFLHLQKKDTATIKEMLLKWRYFERPKLILKLLPVS